VIPSKQAQPRVENDDQVRFDPLDGARLLGICGDTNTSAACDTYNLGIDTHRRFA
jgi:hypothetical protein